MTVFRKKLLILIVALQCCACHQQNTETRLNISAKRLDGSPVALAKVTLDGSTIGETNAFGTFTDVVDLSPESEHDVTVSFDDNTYYYSPHTTKFHVVPGRLNDITVQATMYLAPKPKKTGFKSAATLAPQAARRQASIAPSNLPSDDRFVLPLIPLTTADFARISTSESNTRHQPTIIFTAHAFCGHTPLAGATMIWSQPDSYEYQCTTNDRGRCIIHALANSQLSGTLIARKSGFESTSQTFIPTENQNVRFKLNPGTSLDLRLLSASLRGDAPYDSVKIYDGNNHLATSDINGYAIVPVPTKRMIALKFISPGKGEMVDAGEFTEFNDVIKIKLADQKLKTFEYKISDVHAFKTSDIKLEAPILDTVIGTLIKETAGSQLRSIELSAKADDSNYIGIIPILEGSTKGLTLTLTAFEPSEGLVISEQMAQIPRLASALEAAAATLVDRIKKRQSITGFIKKIDGNQIHVLIDTDAIQIGDTLNIADSDSDRKAIVLSKQKGKLLARLSKALPAKNTWQLLGKKATRLARDSSKISSLSDLMTKLIAKTPESEKIELAKKHRLENNPRQALRDLDINNVADHTTRILLLHEKADAHLALDEKGLALASLYDALSIAMEHAPLSIVNTISININRVRSETLTVVNNDKSLIETLKELDSDNSRLMAHLSEQKCDQIVAATLQYAALLTKQKLAEASLDVASMTTLEQAWESFLKSLKNPDNNERTADLNKAVILARKPFLIKPDEHSIRL